MSQTKAALIHTFPCVLLSFLHRYVESQPRPHPCSRRRLRMCPSTERRFLAWYGKASRVERVKGPKAGPERRVLGSVSPIETVSRKLKECARCWVISGSLFKYLDCQFTSQVYRADKGLFGSRWMFPYCQAFDCFNLRRASVSLAASPLIYSMLAPVNRLQ
jgi:hypothetical protein